MRIIYRFTNRSKSNSVKTNNNNNNSKKKVCSTFTEDYIVPGTYWHSCVCVGVGAENEWMNGRLSLFDNSCMSWFRHWVLYKYYVIANVNSTSFKPNSFLSFSLSLCIYLCLSLSFFHAPLRRPPLHPLSLWRCSTLEYSPQPK